MGGAAPSEHELVESRPRRPRVHRGKYAVCSGRVRMAHRRRAGRVAPHDLLSAVLLLREHGPHVQTRDGDVLTVTLPVVG